MIPESNFYRSYRKGKKARYRIKLKWATADTCSIEKTETGAVIRFPGNITMVATSFEKATGELRYYEIPVAVGFLPEGEYRADKYEDYVEIVFKEAL